MERFCITKRDSFKFHFNPLQGLFWLNNFTLCDFLIFFCCVLGDTQRRCRAGWNTGSRAPALSAPLLPSRGSGGAEPQNPDEPRFQPLCPSQLNSRCSARAPEKELQLQTQIPAQRCSFLHPGHAKQGLCLLPLVIPRCWGGFYPQLAPQGLHHNVEQLRPDP